MENKKTNLGKIIRALIAFLLVLTFNIIGVFCAGSMNDDIKSKLSVLLFVLIGVAVAFFLINVIGFGIYEKKSNVTVEQRRNNYLERRDEALKDLPKSVGRIVLWRRIVVAYSVFIFFFALSFSFLMGVGGQAGLTILPVYLLYGLLTRIAPITKRFSFEGYSTPESYPYLHNLAKNVAEKLGMKGKIRIVFFPDCNAGIAKIGKYYSLQLGVLLLDMLTEDELCQVLIHEFAHITKDGNSMDREYRLFRFITEKEESNFSELLDCMYMLLDRVYTFEYLMYKLSASIAVEKIADESIRQYGDPQTAANALAKIAYNECFNNELDVHMEEHYFAPEQCRENVMTELRDSFRVAVAKRADLWKTMLCNEIQSQSASHPILRNRIKALGVSDFSVEFPEDEGGDYRNECAKALEEVNKIRFEVEREVYAQNRKEQYLEPLSVVEKWQADGESMAAETVRPVMNALMSIGRYDELEALCDKVIAQAKTRFEKGHAYMLKGMLCLNRYDKAGIGLIYEAIDINKNYIDEGMSQIGSFCCRMGLTEELEEYRRRVIDLQQKQEDEYEHANTLTAKDNVCEESMPEDMKKELVGHIIGISEGKIKRIFLLRKVICDSFFSSAFVIQFKFEADEETIDRIMEKIFIYLDTYPLDWQFSLFMYDKETVEAIKKVNNCCVYDSNHEE